MWGWRGVRGVRGGSRGTVEGGVVDTSRLRRITIAPGPSYHQAPSYRQAAPQYQQRSLQQQSQQYYQVLAAAVPAAVSRAISAAGRATMPERYAGQQQNPAPVERRAPASRRDSRGQVHQGESGAELAAVADPAAESAGGAERAGSTWRSG